MPPFFASPGSEFFGGEVLRIIPPRTAFAAVTRSQSAGFTGSSVPSAAHEALKPGAGGPKKKGGKFGSGLVFSVPRGYIMVVAELF